MLLQVLEIMVCVAFWLIVGAFALGLVLAIVDSFVRHSREFDQAQAEERERIRHAQAMRNCGWDKRV
jgi:heme exporter protein D